AAREPQGVHRQSPLQRRPEEHRPQAPRADHHRAGQGRGAAAVHVPARFVISAAMTDYAKDVLVETDWLEQHLDDENIRIVEVDENPALYADAHIPGAIGFDWKKDLQDQVRRDFLGPEEFGELFGSRGISNDHLIVLYGDRNNWFAAYTYWYLKYYGHDNVKLINGPREKWISEGRPTSTDAPSYEATKFNAQPGDDAIRAKRDEVLGVLSSDTR